MSSEPQTEFEFSEENVRNLKEKYSQEMKDDPENPIKVCVKLVFRGATEKDPANRLVLSNDLSKFLIKPGGIINLFLSLIDFDSSSQKATTHNQRFLAVSNIITRLPKICLPYEEYCERITKQLRPLLVHDDPVYSSLASMICNSMIDSPHAQGKDIKAIILNPIFEGLSRSNSQVKANEAIISIANLLNNRMSARNFIPVFPYLFYSLLKLQETPSRLKSILRRSMTSILSQLKPAISCYLLEETIFFRSELYSSYKIKYEDGDISTEFMANSSPKQVRRESVRDLVISLLEQSNNDTFLLEFFFHFQDSMRSTKDDFSRQLAIELVEPFLMNSITEDSSRLDLTNILSSDLNRTSELVYRTLSNYLKFFRDTPEQVIEESVYQLSVESCLDIIKVLSMVATDNQTVLQDCLPVLEEIHKIYEDTENEEDNNFMKKVGMSIEILKQNITPGDYKNSDRSDKDSIQKELDLIIKDLNDELVPVRVHALVRLKQMVLSNNELLIQQTPDIYNMIESTLADEESYVFLASINLIAEMSLRRTGEILPKLVKLYSGKHLSIRQRINVGEVLVKLVRQLKETTPFYCRIIMAVLYEGCKDVNEIIRMSSLTNLGEICKNLGNSLGIYIMDILQCVDSALSDRYIEVRRAAVDLVRTSLSGITRTSAESVQRELKCIYRLLRKMRRTSLDDILILHVDLAMEQLDRLARELILGETNDESPTKNIKILSLLS